MLVFLSMYGPQNAVEAAWARLLGIRKKRSEDAYYYDDKGKIMIEGDQIRIDPHHRPVSVKSALSEGKMHLVCVDPALTTFHGANASFFYFADPPSEFRSRLGRHLSIPTHSDWNDWLWGTGISSSLVQLLEGFGHEVYRVDANQDQWLPLIQEALLNGVIS